MNTLNLLRNLYVSSCVTAASRHVYRGRYKTAVVVRDSSEITTLLHAVARVSIEYQ